MKITCWIMSILFLILTCVALLNVFIEWDGCKTCQDSCAAEVSSRVKSIILTCVEGMCCMLWILLLKDILVEERKQKKLHTQQENAYITKLETNIERKQR